MVQLKVSRVLDACTYKGFMFRCLSTHWYCMLLISSMQSMKMLEPHFASEY